MKGKHIALISCILIFALIVTMGRLFLIKSVEVAFARQPVFADESEIISASKLKLNSNIFTVDEKKLKDNVSEYYSDNSVSIVDVERVFPNKVILHAKERLPVLAIANAKGGYIPTDIDFQLVNTVAELPAGYNFIHVSGISVENDFNLTEFREIREALSSLIDSGLKEEALPVFIKEIKCESSKISFILRSGDGVFVLARGANLGQRMRIAYNEFLILLEKGEIKAFTISK